MQSKQLTDELRLADQSKSDGLNISLLRHPCTSSCPDYLNSLQIKIKLRAVSFCQLRTSRAFKEAQKSSGEAETGYI